MNSNEAYTSDEIHPKVETPDPFAARREVLFAEKGDAWDSFKRKTNGLSVKQISQAKGAEFAEKEGKECRRETSGEKKEIGKGLEREMGRSEERWKGEGGGGGKKGGEFKWAKEMGINFVSPTVKGERKGEFVLKVKRNGEESTKENTNRSKKEISFNRTINEEKSHLKMFESQIKGETKGPLASELMSNLSNCYSLFPKLKYIREKFIEIKEKKSQETKDSKLKVFYSKIGTSKKAEIMLIDYLEDFRKKRIMRMKKARMRKKLINKLNACGKLIQKKRRKASSKEKVSEKKINGNENGILLIKKQSPKKIHSMFLQKGLEGDTKKTENVVCVEPVLKKKESREVIKKIKILPIKEVKKEVKKEEKIKENFVAEIKKKLTASSFGNLNEMVKIKEQIKREVQETNVKKIEFNNPYSEKKKIIIKVKEKKNKKIGKGKITKNIKKYKNMGRGKGSRRSFGRRKVDKKEPKFKFPTYCEVENYVNRISLVNWEDVDPYHEQKIKGTS